jgi:hypothetical protein
MLKDIESIITAKDIEFQKIQQQIVFAQTQLVVADCLSYENYICSPYQVGFFTQRNAASGQHTPGPHWPYSRQWPCS